MPFDVEMAKNITDGEIPGKIVTRDGRRARIACWNYKSLSGEYPLLALIENGIFEDQELYTLKGKEKSFIEEACDSDLMLEIPEYLTFKEGDIIYGEVDNGGGDHWKWLSIIRAMDCICGGPYVVSYVDYNLESPRNCGNINFGTSYDNIGIIRLATEEEKVKFKDRLKKSNAPEAKEYLKRFFGEETSPKVSNSEKIGKFEKRNELMNKETKGYMNSKDLSGPRGSFRKGFCSGWESALTLAKDLIKNSTSLPPEYSKLVDEHFDELI